MKRFTNKMIPTLNLTDTYSDDVKIKKIEQPSIERRANFLLRAFGKRDNYSDDIKTGSPNIHRYLLYSRLNY